MRTFFNVLYWTMRITMWALFIGSYGLLTFLIGAHAAEDPKGFVVCAIVIGVLLAIVGGGVWLYTYAEQRRHR